MSSYGDRVRGLDGVKGVGETRGRRFLLSTELDEVAA